MEQILHLLIVDCERRAALTACFGAAWLLPIVRCGERTRGVPAALRWAEERGIRCDAVGQWLGRMGTDSTDWLLVIRGSSSRSQTAPLCWSSLDLLRSSAGIVDYQRWALSQSLDGVALPSVSGPFGTFDWMDAVIAWIDDATGAVTSFEPYRLGPSEVVLGAHTPCGRVFFKGLPSERACEARLTQTLSAVIPESFARTIALRPLPDGSVWWLAAECPGAMIRDAPNVARALAAVQQRLLTSDAMDAVSRLDLAACARWSSQFFDRATATMLVEHIERVQAAPVPECWSPLDLHPTNIVVDQAGVVRFIDVDGSFRAPAPLTAALFANRCGDRSFYRTYEEAWVPRVKNVDWRPFEISAVAIETWLAWHRFERHVRTGELRGECDFAANRTRARLERALQRL